MPRRLRYRRRRAARDPATAGSAGLRCSPLMSIAGRDRGHARRSDACCGTLRRRCGTAADRRQHDRQLRRNVQQLGDLRIRDAAVSNIPRRPRHDAADIRRAARPPITSGRCAEQLFEGQHVVGVRGSHQPGHIRHRARARRLPQHRRSSPSTTIHAIDADAVFAHRAAARANQLLYQLRLRRRRVVLRLRQLACSSRAGAAIERVSTSFAP